MSRIAGRVSIAVVAITLALPLAASPQTAAVDGARAVNVMPPGQSGDINLTTFLQAQATGNYGPHFADQAGLYQSFLYKPMSFDGGTLWASVPGSYDIYRDEYGVPKIYAKNEPAIYRAFGYAMAADRLFQMDLFRRAGHGTLSEILGEQYVAFDEEVRTVSEGTQARLAELAASEPRIQANAVAFVAGINAYIDEVKNDPTRLPVEFVLLGDLPIEPWTIDDSLAFGEYAGRFFGEWGHGELEMAASLARLTAKHGASEARKIVDDLYPADEPSAPTTIPATVGRFPRHVGSPGTSGGALANTTLAAMGGAPAIVRAAAARARIESTLAGLRHRLGLNGFGSNQFVVDGRHSATGHAMLVSEPQTGLAAPPFFWEVELHGGGFDVRGVTVPALAFVPIGRNQDSAWAVTSALDANSDTYAETLNADGTKYWYEDGFHPISSHAETITCRTPPTAALDLTDGDASSVCTSPQRTIMIRRTVHGPLITEPDPQHHVAYARRSVVDGHLISSLDAWTRATQTRTVADFAKAVSGIAFGFNFQYVDRAGHAAYFHAGRYPIRPADIDARFPIPGTGPWEWRGFEPFAAQPHAVDPPGGFLANWNNKPAVGWTSKPLGGDTIPPSGPARTVIATWGPTHQVEPIQQDLADLSPQLTFLDMGRVERHVASIDNRARSWMPALLAAIDASGDASLSQARTLLASWGGRRIDANRDDAYDAPGLAIFDRWVEKVLAATFDELDGETFIVASGVRDDGTYASSDNEDTPSFKIENALFGTFTHALRGDSLFDYFAGSRRDAVLLASLRAAMASLASEQGSDPAAWRAPAEHEPYPAQGGGAADDVVPTVNRGSYGQIVEPGGGPQAGIFSLD